MMNLNDYRQTDAPDLSPQERQLQNLQRNNAGLLQLIAMGEAMSAWIETPAGRALAERLEREISEAVSVILSSHDLSSEKVKVAHFNARVCISAAKKIEETLNAGSEAEAHLRAEIENPY